MEWNSRKKFFKLINLKSSLVSNFFSLVILQGANYIFPLITVPYLFRTLGVETFGLISFATAFSQYFVILTDFGFNLYGVQFIAANRDNKEIRDVFFLNVLASQILLFIIGLVLLLGIIFTFDKFYHNCWLYLLSYMTVFGTVLMPAWFFQGIEQMKFITNINIITKGLAILPIFFFVEADGDAILVPLFYGLGSIVAGAIALYVSITNFNVEFKFKKITTNGMKTRLKESATFFLSRISVSIYTVSNTFVLGLIGGNVAVGYYSAAEKLYLAIQSMFGPLNNALYPYMVKNKNLNVFKKIFILVLFINCIGLPVCIYYSDFILRLVYKNVAIESIITLKILLGVCLISVPSILLGYPLLGAFGEAKFINLTVIIASIFHFIMLIVLIVANSVTVYFVAFLVVLTELLVFLLRIYGVRKLILKKQWKI